MCNRNPKKKEKLCEGDYQKKSNFRIPPKTCFYNCLNEDF